MTRKRFCDKCSFHSTEHGACFHPDSFTPGIPFKSPGDPAILNRDHRCRRYDGKGPMRGTLRKIWRLFRSRRAK